MSSLEYRMPCMVTANYDLVDVLCQTIALLWSW